MNSEIYNAELEQQVLGALLLNPTRIVDLPSQDAEMFFDPAHESLFKEIRSRTKKDQLVSPVALRNWALNQAVLEPIGGPQYLLRLASASISGSQIGQYGAMLSEMRAKRRIADAIAEASQAISSDSDTASVISGRLEAALALGGQGSTDGPVSMRAAVTNALEEVNDVRMGKEVAGVKTGIPSLDNLLGKFSPGQMILLGGRPSMGKSAVALAMALNVARAGSGVVIATLEMDPESMARRAMSEASSGSQAPTPYSEMLRGTTEPQMRSLVGAAQSVSDLPIQFLPPNYRDVGALYSGVKKCKALMNGNLGLVVVDYLQLLQAEGRSRLEQITQISIALKAMAMQLGVPILALSQLSRALESRDDKRPVMSDLRESGQLEQDADAILFCYRDEYYLEREEPDARQIDVYEQWRSDLAAAKGHLDIIVAKQRMGAVGTVKVRFNPALNKIWEEEHYH